MRALYVVDKEPSVDLEQFGINGGTIMYVIIKAERWKAMESKQIVYGELTYLLYFGL